MPKGKRRGNKSGAGHKSRQDVPSSDEDSLDNASIISNFSESRSVMDEGNSEEVDEQTQEEVFEEKLKEAIDGINQKSAQGRTMSLEAVSKAFVKKFIPEFIVDRRLTVTDGIERSLRKGRGAEQAAAAHLASLLCLQLGGGDSLGLGGDGAGGSADQAFRDLRPVLITLANDGSTTYPARAKCCMALGLCSFVSGGELQEVVELMCTLENIFWLASSSSVQASNPEAATLYSAALSAWGLLLTLMAPGDVYSLMGRQLSRLVTLLESASLDVRIAAGEAIAVATELGRIHDADFTIGGKGCDNEDLIETLRGLATDSHKYRAKKDRKQQRSSFRDILHFVEEGEQPDVQVKFGQEMLSLDTWCRKKQYDAFCQVLGPGMNLHLTENYLVREIFELGERVSLLNGAVYKASKLERHLMNAAAFKARTILRSKNRDKRSATAM
ncbi:interferon-related developmental regulator 2 [Ischnura elegans]|uniref:interferon-related developmental regulator 2 n=1 Tax=Ischnura elegans TaxID=197161 RepID=UPI001ED89D3F|nr:interferon-related developmental regulator 2 [Ischnura elegans]